MLYKFILFSILTIFGSSIKPTDMYKDTPVIRGAKPTDMYKDTPVIRGAKPTDMYKDTNVTKSYIYK